MNCPNCHKKPVGFIHYLRFYGVGVKKALTGYFKCRHCNTLLKEESQSDTSQYDSPYWFFMGGYLLLILAALFSVLYLIVTNSISTSYLIFGLIVFLWGLMGVMNSYVTPRYWTIKEVRETEDSEEQPPKKLTAKGWTIFLIYSIVAITLFIAIPEFLHETQLFDQYLLPGIFIYSMAVIGGAMYILIRYSTRVSENANSG